MNWRSHKSKFDRVMHMHSRAISDLIAKGVFIAAVLVFNAFLPLIPAWAQEISPQQTEELLKELRLKVDKSDVAGAQAVLALLISTDPQNQTVQYYSKLISELRTLPKTSVDSDPAEPLRTASTNVIPLYPYSPCSDLAVHEHKGAATLSCDVEESPNKVELKLDVRFRTVSGGLYYNPFFREGWPQPAVLAVYDVNTNYLGDLFARFSGSQWGIGRSLWTNMPANAVIGAERIVPFQRIHRMCATGLSTIRLEPGSYFVQLIFLPRFIEPFPLRAAEAEAVGHELFRSNAVRVRLEKGER